MELQISSNVQLTALYAFVPEGLLLQQKSTKSSFPKTQYAKTENKSSLATGDLWKAKQLKEYRRANGLCYKCGEKFAPGHMCDQAPAPRAQFKAAELVDPHEIISDAVLDALVQGGPEECATISATAMSSKNNSIESSCGKQSCVDLSGLGQHTHIC